ncbi:uncharacterized protein BDV17DRAFT_192417 [Aspergillus undulatus]|uniref:uncharacterized protein n=1 Tax=Aspergillus undulatus TaxID=1810928 RepID=UPI003CCD68B4
MHPVTAQPTQFNSYKHYTQHYQLAINSTAHSEITPLETALTMRKTRFIELDLISPEKKMEMEQGSLACKPCLICWVRIQPENMVEFGCNHMNCRECVAQLSRFSFPPSCCDRPLPEEDILRCISAEEMATLKSKAEEQKTPLTKRWYCPDTSCGKWIPQKQLLVKGPRFIPSRKYACPHCKTSICSRCRGHGHDGACPPTDPNLTKVLAMADTEKWRKCNRCGTLTEKTDGSCNTMYCRCGAAFCYICGGNRANGRCACYWATYVRTVKTRAKDVARAVLGITEV